jgi:hypothetical protein
MHNYARLKDPALMQNYFIALSRLIGINPSAAFKGFNQVSVDMSLTGMQNVMSNEWLQSNGITSQIQYLRKLLNEAASTPGADVNNVFEFLDGTGQKHSAFTSVYALRSFIELFEDLDDFEPGDFDIGYCHECEEYEWDQKMVTAYGDNEICRDCAQNHYVYLEYYDQYVHESETRIALYRDGAEVTVHEDDDSFHWSDEDDCYVHRDYESASSSDPDLFGDYHESKRHQHPISNDWSTANQNRYFGVELEVESKVDRTEKIRSIHSVLNDGNEVGHRCFFERDGSLSSGFEIITQPMGLDMHESWWKWLKDPSLISGLRSHNTSTCGLHVHVSRDRIQDIQLNKMITFVNHPDNAKLMQSIARRYDTNYAQIKQKNVNNATEDCERYDAVNISTDERKTVEFRLFKGSLRYEAVIAAIQFVNSLTVFCGQGHFDLSTERFLAFISSNPNNECLLAYINERMYGITPNTTTV